MKTYKHKTNGSTMTFKDGCMKIENLVIEGTPNLDYWEEVVEKEYEILSFTNGVDIFTKQSNGIYRHQYETADRGFENKWRTEKHLLEVATECKICSVKRISDNIVFYIGDKVYRRNFKKLPLIIEKIIIDEKDDVRFIQGKESDEDYCDVLMKYVEKCEEPLFTTLDGVDIYVGTTFFYIGDYGDIEETKCLFKGDEDFTKSKTFAKKESAEKYLKENQKRFSLNDIKEAKKKLGCFGDTLIKYLESL